MKKTKKMKNTILLFSLLVGLILCKPGSETWSMPNKAIPFMFQSNLNTNDYSKQTTRQLDTVPGEYAYLKSILKGKWYQKAYIESLKQTKSLVKAHKLSWLVNLNMSASRLQGDTLSVRASSVNEGYRFNVFLKQPGKTKHTFCTDIITFQAGDRAEFGYAISKKDTVLKIIYYDSKGKLLNKIIYKKTPKTQLLPTRYMVNKTLFTGHYTVRTSGKSQAFEVQLLSNGHIKGWQGLKRYNVIINFVTGRKEALDRVVFNSYKENEKKYTYQISGDTIKIFIIKKDETYQPYIGNLVFTLVKKRT